MATINESSSDEIFTGRVKWFNNKSGFGFITITDGPKSASDIFVHHSAIKVDSEQYKYLVQGEYVEFKLLATSEGPHYFQAGDVCGIKGGKLMCQTRNEIKKSYNSYRDVKKNGTSHEGVTLPKSRWPADSEWPSESETTREGDKWSYASKESPSNKGKGRRYSKQISSKSKTQIY